MLLERPFSDSLSRVATGNSGPGLRVYQLSDLSRRSPILTGDDRDALGKDGGGHCCCVPSRGSRRTIHGPPWVTNGARQGSWSPLRRRCAAVVPSLRRRRVAVVAAALSLWIRIAAFDVRKGGGHRTRRPFAAVRTVIMAGGGAILSGNRA